MGVQFNPPFSSQEAEGGDLAEVWKRMSTNLEKYLPDSFTSTFKAMFLTDTPRVIFEDQTAIQLVGHRLGHCNWGLLLDTFLPLGFGVAFYQGTPYKEHFDQA